MVVSVYLYTFLEINWKISKFLVKSWKKIDKIKYMLENINIMAILSKDWKIIDVLKQNSRESIKEIAKKTKIRPSTVHQRIHKLVENKTIEKFTIKLDNKAAGENFIVFMLVKGSTTDYLDKNFLNSNHVKEVFGITGEYDLLAKLKFNDVEEFNDFILDFRKNKKDIQSTLTMIATTNLKEES
tara:strand:- start:387 stop:938 length:552 start_codon:yes stop_codon:yes gene_type:complete